MPRVLLAEDENAVRDMLRTALERDGFEVVAVANVCEALSRIATEAFDVLLSDLHMPLAGDGFTVVSAMRHSNRMRLPCWSAVIPMCRAPWPRSFWKRMKSS